MIVKSRQIIETALLLSVYPVVIHTGDTDVVIYCVDKESQENLVKSNPTAAPLNEQEFRIAVRS